MHGNRQVGLGRRPRASAPDAPARRPAIHQFEDDAPLTYAEFDRQCNHVGNAFAEVGIGCGDRVAIIAFNRLEYLWTWIGLSRIGAVAVAVNTAYKGRFLTHVLTNAEARMGVVEREFLSLARGDRGRHPGARDGVCAGPAARAGRGASVQAHRLPHLRGAARRCPDDDPARSELSRYRAHHVHLRHHRALQRRADAARASVLVRLGMQVHMGLTPEDRYYICMPLFHAQGLLMQIYSILQAGG